MCIYKCDLYMCMCVMCLWQKERSIIKCEGMIKTALVINCCFISTCVHAMCVYKRERKGETGTERGHRDMANAHWQECVCVCVCVRERERHTHTHTHTQMGWCILKKMLVLVCVCMTGWVSECMCVQVCVCVCVRERERTRIRKKVVRESWYAPIDVHVRDKKTEKWQAYICRKLLEEQPLTPEQMM